MERLKSSVEKKQILSSLPQWNSEDLKKTLKEDLFRVIEWFEVLGECSNLCPLPTLER